MLVALIVRSLFLGRCEMWGDEINHLNIQANPRLSTAMIFKSYWDFVVSMAQLPLPGVTLNAYAHLIQAFSPNAIFSPGLMRIPSLLFGTGAVAGFYWLSRSVLKRNAHAVAVAFMTLFFFPVYYSREVYCYHYVLFFASFTLYAFVRAAFDDRPRWKHVIMLAACSAGLTLSHFGGTMLLVAIGGVAGLLWIYNTFVKRNPARSAGLARVLLACGVGAAAVAPYWFRILTTANPHMAGESGVPASKIAWDVVSKMHWGDHTVSGLTAILALAAGIVAWTRARTRKPAQLALAAVFVVGFLLLLEATKKSQYLSARYFSPLLPVAYLISAQGLAFLASLAGRVKGAPAWLEKAILVVLAGIPVGLSLSLYLPNMYALREKGIPYASVAKWLNANMAKGTPYFFDCGGWDLRYVPGFHATPDLTPTVYVAFNGPDFDRVKKGVQRDVMHRFPESAYIEDPGGAWDEAHAFYRQKVELRNQPLIRLRRLGIWIDANTRREATEFRDVYYNTRDDALAIARQKGDAAFFDYEGFRCTAIAQETYVRVMSGSLGSIRATNLTNRQLKGHLVLEGAVIGPAQQYRVDIYAGGSRLLSVDRPANAGWRLETPSYELPAEPSGIQIDAQPALGGDARGIAIMNLSFQPDP